MVNGDDLAFFRIPNEASEREIKERNIAAICTYAPRLDISLKKNSHDLEIWPWPTCRSILGDGIRQKNIFQPQVFVFEFTNQLYIFFKFLYLEVCHFRSENIFLANTIA